MTVALEGGEWSTARPGRTLPPGKTRYPFYRRLGGPQGTSGWAENLVPTGIYFIFIYCTIRYLWGTLHTPIVSKFGSFILLESSETLQACSGIALPLPFFFILLLYSCVHSFSPTLCLSSFTSFHPHIFADSSHAKSSTSSRMLSGLMSLWTIRLLCR